MLQLIKKTIFLTASGLLTISACGSDDDPSSKPSTDAGSKSVDAKVTPPPSTTFSGTVSLAEVIVTNPEGIAIGLAGGVANVSFTAPADVKVKPQPGYTNPINDCKIFVYDVEKGEKSAAGSDGGPISISGDGVFSSFGCSYQAALDKYLCSIDDDAASGALATGASISPVDGQPGQVALSVPGVDFSGAEYKGMFVNLTGFIGDNADAANGKHPILANHPTVNNILILANAKLEGASTVGETEGHYDTFVGAGPIPGGFPEFIDSEYETEEAEGKAKGDKKSITITKAEKTDAPKIDTTLIANGDLSFVKNSEGEEGVTFEAFTLADNSAQPHNFPLDGTAVTFSCEKENNGSCGGANGTLKGIVTFGETTDAPIPEGASFSDMPDPVKKYATWQCSGIGSETITIKADAIAVILGTKPTRIQTTVVYSNAETGNNNILASHGLLGWTDVLED